MQNFKPSALFIQNQIPETMSKKKSPKKAQVQKTDTGAAIAATSSSVSFPPAIIKTPDTTKRSAL